MSMRSRSEADARPVRTVLNSLRACSTDLPIPVSASPIYSAVVAMPRALLPGLDDGADILTGDDAGDVAVGELEHVNCEPVVHAERERGRVHALEPAVDCLEVRQARQEARIGIFARVAVVDAAHAVLRHQDGVRADLEGSQRGGGIGGEERVAGAGGEDD